MILHIYNFVLLRRICFFYENLFARYRMFVMKLLKEHEGHPQIESQHCRKGHVVTEFILVHSRELLRPSFSSASSNQTHAESPFLTWTLLLELTWFYLSLSSVNGLCRALRACLFLLSLYSPLLCFSLCESANSHSLLFFSSYLPLFLYCSCVSSYTFLFLSYLSLELGSIKIGLNGTIGMTLLFLIGYLTQFRLLVFLCLYLFAK